MVTRYSNSEDDKTLVRHMVIKVPLAVVMAVVLASTMAVWAQTTTPPPSLSNSQVTASGPSVTAGAPMGSSLIYPEDVLDVYVYDVPELSRLYTVSAAGTITVPLLSKPVQAAGLSPDELARSLEESFRQSGRLSHAQITVSVQQSRRSVVIVEGAVKSPQPVPVIGPTSLISVLTQCGGRSDDAGSTITVTRGDLALHELAHRGTVAKATETVQFKNLMDPTDPMSKVEVWPGDRVYIERAGIFYVLGQVVRPGGYNLKSSDEQVSILQALALAGDVTPIAKTGKAVLIRKDPAAHDGRKEIAVDVKAILQGSSPDPTLRPDDILYIPTSGGKQAMRTAAALGTTVAGAAGAAAVYARY